MKLPLTLPAPELPGNLSAKAKWLAGEGAGSWFLIEPISKKHQYRIRRYSPEGRLECSGIFHANTNLDLDQEYSVGYPSHCLKVTIVQARQRIVLINEGV